MTPKVSLRVLAVLLLVLLVVSFLVACESSTSPEPTATTGPVTPGAVTTPSPAGDYPTGPLTTPYP